MEIRFYPISALAACPPRCCFPIDEKSDLLLTKEKDHVYSMDNSRSRKIIVKNKFIYKLIQLKIGVGVQAKILHYLNYTLFQRQWIVDDIQIMM